MMKSHIWIFLLISISTFIDGEYRKLALKRRLSCDEKRQLKIAANPGQTFNEELSVQRFDGKRFESLRVMGEFIRFLNQIL
jgi:hypothetical protein